jgi:hypothetical protein
MARIAGHCELRIGAGCAIRVTWTIAEWKLVGPMIRIAKGDLRAVNV